MDGSPLFPKKPYPDLLHTPRETRVPRPLSLTYLTTQLTRGVGCRDGLVKSPTLRTTHREAVTQLEFLDLKDARVEGTLSQ